MRLLNNLTSPIKQDSSQNVWHTSTIGCYNTEIVESSVAKLVPQAVFLFYSHGGEYMRRGYYHGQTGIQVDFTDQGHDEFRLQNMAHDSFELHFKTHVIEYRAVHTVDLQESYLIKFGPKEYDR